MTEYEKIITEVTGYNERVDISLLVLILIELRGHREITEPSKNKKQGRVRSRTDRVVQGSNDGWGVSPVIEANSDKKRSV